jgi:hypothetical protein
MSKHRIDASVRFSQEQQRDRFLKVLNSNEPRWDAEPLEGFTSDGINMRACALAAWSVAVDDPRKAQNVVDSIGRRLRDLAADDPEILKAVEVSYMLHTEREK